MRITFLSGPAGSGKTFRCVHEAATELSAAPDGPPLLFLAPRQSTFQLERMVLSQPGAASFSRLHILSFARLAQFVFEQSGQEPPRVISEEGRVMVLRSLLARHGHELRMFRASARRAGFAAELSGMLREFQSSHVDHETLTRAGMRQTSPRLADKLHDLALLLKVYEEWLARERLADADTLFVAAGGHLQTGPESLRFGHIWLDGFATLHVHETRLLHEVVARSDGATLAFCCAESEAPHLEMVRLTRQRLWDNLLSVKGAEIHAVELPRETVRSRFARSPSLAHLERVWSTQNEWKAPAEVALVEAANAEEEVIHTARTILRHVHQGGRFREVGVMVRQLDEWHDPVRRIFDRYGIPCFIDGRQPVTHHPLAELTRGAVAAVVFGWHHADVMRALKSGLTPLSVQELDWLENECLGRWGDTSVWKPDWTRPEKYDVTVFERLTLLRQRVLTPLENLAATMGRPRLNGPLFADAIAELWRAFGVEETLARWGGDSEAGEAERDQGVLEQCRAWLQSLRTAFAHADLAPSDWIPIMDSGLSALSVGLIPPVLDQVVVGAVDRTRNPELQLTLILGLNEQMFPNIAEAPLIVSERERLLLESDGIVLPSGEATRLANEQFLSYIALTRSSGRTVAVWSRHDDAGAPLNPSGIVRRLQRIFPSLQVRQPDLPAAGDPEGALIPQELFDGFLGDESFVRWLGPDVPPVLEPDRSESLQPVNAEKLYGKCLVTSASRFEDFGRCPFRFFTSQGLGVREREKFELGAREQGSLMHEVLAEFHNEITLEKKRWRDLSPDQAASLMGRVVDWVGPRFEMGLAARSARNRFLLALFRTRLQGLASTLVDWMRFYQFDPLQVEARFDAKGVFPALTLQIDAEHQLSFIGKIDRVDWNTVDGGERVFTIIDYKTVVQPFKRVMVTNGLQIQMLVYLRAVEKSQPESARCAGVFYIGLGRGERRARISRIKATEENGPRNRGDHQMLGLFRLEDRLLLDSDPAASQGVHLKGKLKKDGTPHASGFNALPDREFRALVSQFEEDALAAGRSIYGGSAGIIPYRRGAETACSTCFYGGVCRIDPWTHRSYRELI